MYSDIARTVRLSHTIQSNKHKTDKKKEENQQLKVLLESGSFHGKIFLWWR